MKKANSIQAVLGRNVKVSDQNLKATAYKTFVRPHVEYCSSVWDPYTKDHKHKLEMVQRRAARWVFGKYRRGPNTTGPTEMISLLGWPSLEERRRAARLCMLHKIVNGQVLMTTRSLLISYPYDTQSMPSHAFTPLDKLPPKLYYSMSFFPRTVAEWNKLPPSVAAIQVPADFRSAVLSRQP